MCALVSSPICRSMRMRSRRTEAHAKKVRHIEAHAKVEAHEICRSVGTGCAEQGKKKTDALLVCCLHACSEVAACSKHVDSRCHRERAIGGAVLRRRSFSCSRLVAASPCCFLLNDVVPLHAHSRSAVAVGCCSVCLFHRSSLGQHEGDRQRCREDAGKNFKHRFD